MTTKEMDENIGRKDYKIQFKDWSELTLTSPIQKHANKYRVWFNHSWYYFTARDVNWIYNSQ